jgi:uncharacterized metal-binding protein YceD (DUF177 family)
MIGSAILSNRVDIGRLPAEAVEIAASKNQRKQLAAAYDLVDVAAFAATVALLPGPRGSIEVEGRVVADIVQTCVVSLVPVTQHIDEAFRVRFIRPSDAPPAPKPGAEVVIDPAMPDPPEILEGQTIDVGAVAEEAFVLAIDPYPRAPGATLPSEATAPLGGAADSPFAALAGLADRLTGKG